MEHTTPPHADTTIVVRSADFDIVGMSVLGWLAGYSSARTRKCYERSVKFWRLWCETYDLDVFQATRTHIELYARSLEARGLKPGTVSSYLTGICSWYQWCHVEGYVVRDPSQHVRRPKVPRMSAVVRMDRNQLAALLATGQAHGGTDHALTAMLVINGLRVGEAISADIEDLGNERGHTTLKIMRKGSKPALIPLPPRVARAIALATGERTSGPILVDAQGRRLNNFQAWRIIKRLARRAGIPHHVHPHAVRHAAITTALDAGCSVRDVQDYAGHEDPRTTMYYDRNRGSLDRNSSYVVAAYVAGGG